MMSLTITFLLLLKILPISESSSFRIDKFFEQSQRQTLEDLIDTIVEDISKKSECILFVFDSYYQRIIHFHWIRRTSVVPVYTMVIRDSEVFFPPRKRVELILGNSKSAGCNAYVILVANGLQVAQFLEYTEKNRMINTHGLFLLIHDWRLFDEGMKYIWNRIINVVFIRRFNAIKRRSGERNSRELYNLETVSYPIRFRGFVLTRYLDTWYRGKFRYKIDHFSPKNRDLRKKSLRVAVFEHIPAITRKAGKIFDKFSIEGNSVGQSDKALGIEFELMKIIAKKMNFNPDFYAPQDVRIKRWGRAGENDSFDGLLGEAVAGNAAFFIGDLHYTLRHHRLLDLSIPYNTECLTFLTPESLTDNSWKLLIVPFRLYTWIAVMLTLFLGAYIIHLFAVIHWKYISLHIKRRSNIGVVTKAMQIFKEKPRKGIVEKDKSLEGLELFTEPVNSVLYTYSMLLQVSLPRIPIAWALRVFIGWWWLYSILVTVAYRASMTATLANPIGRVTIDTIEELARSRIAVGGWADEQKELFLSSSDKDVRKIGERFELTTNEEEAIARVANGTFCYYENIYVLKHARATRQQLEFMQMINATKHREVLKADRDLHVMQECLIDMPISIGMDKNSPLKPQVDHLVRRVVEAGFVAKWLSDVTEWSKIVELRYKSPSEQTLVNLHKLHGSFVALGIGYFVSLVVLIIEKLHWKYIVTRHPAYDKYQMDVFYANTGKFKLF